MAKTEGISSYSFAGKELPLELLDDFNKYLSQIRSAGIEKEIYQPFLKSLLTRLPRVPFPKRKALIRTECREFIKRHGKA